MRALLDLNFLNKYRDYAAFALRLVIGSFLVWGTQDNVLSGLRMNEFALFLAERGTPLPLFSAYLSAYAQFICGTLIILGLLTRYAGAIMVVNFIFAIVIAHIGDSFRLMFPALVMLASAIFLLLHGAGKPSLDAWLNRQRGAAV